LRARGIVREAQCSTRTFNHAARNLAARQAARFLLKNERPDDGALRLIGVAVAAC
jgi:hypothetical protein